jgi:hypothetical protein
MTPLALGRRALLGTAAAAALRGRGNAEAASLARPAEKPILTIGGKIALTNDATVARFDRPMLEALGHDSIRTLTPWFDTPVRFEGVPMVALMQAVGATGGTIRVAALDDYSADLPMADFAKYGTLLALKLDGRYLTIADKGPSFIIYPFDTCPELRTTEYYRRSVWQIATITVI